MDIHYSDAILTAIFGGIFSFVIWCGLKVTSMQSELKSVRLQSQNDLLALELRLTQVINKANSDGAATVAQNFKELIERKTS